MNVVTITILQMGRLIRPSYLMILVSKRGGLTWKSVLLIIILYQLLKAGKMHDAVERSKKTVALGDQGAD